MKKGVAELTHHWAQQRTPTPTQNPQIAIQSGSFSESQPNQTRVALRKRVVMLYRLGSRTATRQCRARRALLDLVSTGERYVHQSENVQVVSTVFCLVWVAPVLLRRDS